MIAQVFSDVIYGDMNGSCDTGQRLNQSIIAPLKKEMMKTCKPGNKGVEIRNHNHSRVARRWYEISY